MRSILMSFAIIVCFIATTVRAEEATAEDKAFFEKQVGKLVKLEAQPLTGESLGKVFTAKFFNLEVRIGADGGGMDLIVARSGDNIVEVTKPGSTSDMPDLKALVKADFKLKTEANAKTFEAALDQLYPIDARFDKEDLKAKAIKQKGTEWTFIRGKFFDDFKGIIVKTDADGNITSIQHSLDIKK